MFASLKTALWATFAPHHYLDASLLIVSKGEADRVLFLLSVVGVSWPPVVALGAGLVAIAAKVWEPRIRFWPRFVLAFAIGYPLVLVFVPSPLEPGGY